jgi:cobaltochelatase CobT
MVDAISKKCSEVLLSSSNIRYKRYDDSLDIYEMIPEASQYRVKQYEESVRPYINGVRPKLLSALISQGKTRWQTHLDNGQIDTARLPQLIAGTSDKIFKRRVTGKSRSTAVTMLIDTSGSMSGSQIKMARSVAMIFADTLSRANIKTRVVGFDGSGNLPPKFSDVEYRDVTKNYTHIAGVRYSVLKKFEEPYRMVKARFPNITTGGITPLAPALIHEVRALLERSEERKLLMVLTDGAPNCDGQVKDEDNLQMCRDIISDAERIGVEAMGIGIGLDVSGVFDKNVTVNELNELPKTVVNQLYKQLIN